MTRSLNCALSHRGSVDNFFANILSIGLLQLDDLSLMPTIYIGHINCICATLSSSISSYNERDHWS